MPINEGAQPRRANEEQGKPGTNEEQRGPTANGEQRQPREQAPSGAARPGGAARRWAATAGQWSATALRLGARWLHSVPATRAVAAALLVGVGVCLAWSGAFPLGSASADPSHWWSLVTAPFVFPRTSMGPVLLTVLPPPWSPPPPPSPPHGCWRPSSRTACPSGAPPWTAAPSGARAP